MAYKKSFRGTFSFLAGFTLLALAGAVLMMPGTATA